MDAVVESFKPMFIMLGCAFALLVVLRIFLLWWNSPNAAGTGPAKPLKNGPFVGPVPKS